MTNASRPYSSFGAQQQTAKTNRNVDRPPPLRNEAHNERAVPGMSPVTWTLDS